jgi:hypothetical protein
VAADGVSSRNVALESCLMVGMKNPAPGAAR